MKDLPPPPDLALAFGFEEWALVALLALLAAILVALQVAFGRRAYLGGRFIDALGGYAAAARHLDDIERTNEARLFVGMHAHAKHNEKRKTK